VDLHCRRAHALAEIAGQPAIGSDGTLYVLTADATNPNGAFLVALGP
jgi:hypothetical protein